MVDKSSLCLNLHRATYLGSDSNLDRAEAFPKNAVRQTIFPFPKAFLSIFLKEWQSHSKGLEDNVVDKLYTLPEKQISLFKVPVMDAPLASLSSSSIPVDGDVWPRDPTDQKLESSLRCNFEMSAFSFRTASANLGMSCATFIWAQEASKNKKLPKAFKCTLKKIA